MIKYLDIHSHLNSSKYDADRDEVLKRLEENETGTIVIGTDLESSRSAVELAENHQNIWACIGVHPVDDPSRIFDKKAFQELVISPKVVAIGECGLDFFRTPRSLGEVGQQDYERQKKLFLEQIDFALENNLPIMIHSRDAYEELLEVLEPLKTLHPKLRGNVHFFAGSLEVAKRFFNIGFTISFTGVITFTQDYDEVIKNSSLDMILSETDAPYVAPVPYRGKRNEPSYVREVTKRIARIRGEDEESVRKVLLANACREFGLVLE